ncbi:MAG: sensor domain-containing diguanylate cyclase [Lachnospiraceae bacterium]|nr:sensor domain-containing diguanylate cyclase [Lachnospiraceae bacterium]
MHIYGNSVYSGPDDEESIKKINRDIMRFLAEKYLFLLFHNVKDDILSIRFANSYTPEESVRTLNKIGDYSGGFDEMAKKYAHPEDRQRICEALKPENYIEALKDKKEYSIYYRWKKGEDYRYNKITFSKLEKEEEEPNTIIIVGIDVDEDVRMRNEQEEKDRIYRSGIYALCREYASVYYVNLKTGKVTPYNMSSRIEGMFGDHFYFLDYDSAIEEYISKAVIPDERDKMRVILSRDYVGAILKRQEYFTKVYLNNENKYCEMKCVKIEYKDGIMEVVMGFAVKDDEIRREQTRKKQREFQMSLLDGLSREYRIVWLLRRDYNMQLYRTSDDEPSKEVVELGYAVGMNYANGFMEYVNRYIHEDDRDRIIKETNPDILMSKIPNRGLFTVTYRRLKKDGGFIYVQVCFAKAEGLNGETNIVLAARNVDDLVREQLRQKELYDNAVRERDIDGLTGLLNRLCYERRLDDYTKELYDNLNCIYIDIDGLHEYNNTYGHDAGDEMIRCTASAILEQWGNKNSYRIGGDEFVIFVYDTDITDLYDNIEFYRKKVTSQGYSLSIGYSRTETDRAVDIHDLIKSAEERMYDEKRRHNATRERRS